MLTKIHANTYKSNFIYTNEMSLRTLHITFTKTSKHNYQCLLCCIGHDHSRIGLCWSAECLQHFSPLLRICWRRCSWVLERDSQLILWAAGYGCVYLSLNHVIQTSLYHNGALNDLLFSVFIGKCNAPIFSFYSISDQRKQGKLCFVLW